MRFADGASEDFPDPRRSWAESARLMPVPILGLVPQPHLEDWGGIGVESSTRDGELDMYAVSISYTLWRNPDDPADPANLAELDEPRRRALETQPAAPRPAWLTEHLRRLRYPLLWECVRTRWCRDPHDGDTVDAQLVEHMNNVLMNEFRASRVAGDDPPFELINPAHEGLVEPGSPVLVDGVVRDSVRVDTDPDVVGVGVDQGGNTVLTAVIPRYALPWLDVAFAVRAG